MAEFRPSVTPPLAYNPDRARPLIPGFVTEAIMMLTSGEDSDLNVIPGGGVSAVVRILGSMAQPRWNGSDDAEGRRYLPEHNPAHCKLARLYQSANIEQLHPHEVKILRDGTVVLFRKKCHLYRSIACSPKAVLSADRFSVNVEPSEPASIVSSIWRRLSSNTPWSGRHAREPPAPERCENCLGAEIEIDLTSQPIEASTDQEDRIGPLEADGECRSVQGYTWNDWSAYESDVLRRRMNWQYQLGHIRQFMSRRPADDIRHGKKRIWLHCRGLQPVFRLLFRLKWFYRKPCPVFDHFQLKNLLAVRKNEIIYFQHAEQNNKTYTCAVSFNAQTNEITPVAGPWVFNQLRSMSGSDLPPLSSISFDSACLYALECSENYIAVADTSSSVLLIDRKNPSDVLCQRVSSQALQITNCIKIIENDRLGKDANLSADHLDVVRLIRWQASEKGRRVVTATVDVLEKLCVEAADRVSVAAGFAVLAALIEPEPPHREEGPAELRRSRQAGRRVLRIRSLFTSNNASTQIIRESPFTISIDHNFLSPDRGSGNEADSRMTPSDEAPSPADDAYLPTPKHTDTIITAGNDRTLCEYVLDSNLCLNESHFELKPGVSVCHTRQGLVSGFSTCKVCTVVPKPGTPQPVCAKRSNELRMNRSLRLVKSWTFPFCINHIALHPDKNLMLLVGDSPRVLLMGRRRGNEADQIPGFSPYFAERGAMLKGALYVLDAHQDACFAAAWHPNGYMFATGSDDMTVCLWDLRNLACPLGIIACEVSACRSLEFSPDGKFLVSCESEDSVTVYHVDKIEAARGLDARPTIPAQPIPFFGGCTGAKFSEDSKRLIIAVAITGATSGLIELVLNKIPTQSVELYS